MLMSLIVRSAVVAAAWLAVTELRPSTLVYALVAVPVGVAVTYVVTGVPTRARSLRISRGLATTVASMRFVGWVARSAVVGGIDVARRSFWLPRPDVDPVWVVRRTTLSTTTGRVTLALALNLTPGTLSARIDGDELDVHVITTELDIDGTLDALETRIAAIERALA
ncbi:MAG: Na+/H+ antiporter subunit E [Microcella sp.]